MREQRDSVIAGRKSSETGGRNNAHVTRSTGSVIYPEPLPEEDVKGNSEEYYHQPEDFSNGGGFHLNNAFVLQNDSFATGEVVEEGKNRADHHDGDQADGHTVEESHFGAAELEGTVFDHVDGNAQPAEVARALRNSWM